MSADTLRIVIAVNLFNLKRVLGPEATGSSDRHRRRTLFHRGVKLWGESALGRGTSSDCLAECQKHLPNYWNDVCVCVGVCVCVCVCKEPWHTCIPPLETERNVLVTICSRIAKGKKQLWWLSSALHTPQANIKSMCRLFWNIFEQIQHSEWFYSTCT